MTPLQIIIIGGGLGGLAAAISLCRAGHQVTVLERAKQFGTVGGSIHLPPNACRALKSLDVLDNIMTLPGMAFQPQHISLLTSETGIVLKRVNLLPDMERKYGLPYLSVQRTSLHQCLLQCAFSAGASIKLDVCVESIDFESSAVFLAGGIVIGADMVIGADGENSWCRSMLLGRPDPPIHFGHQIFSCHIPLSQLDHEGSDLSRFKSDPGASWWMGPGTMVIATTTKGQQEGLNLMGGLVEPVSAEIHSRPIERSKDDVKAAFENWDPVINKLVDASTSCHAWTSTVSPVLSQWNHPSGSFTLLGDAAHAMTPYLAQGAAQCLEDAVVLGTVLSRITDRKRIPEILHIYQSVREPRCRRIKHVSMELRDVYCESDSNKRQIRDHDLQYCTPGPGFIIPWIDPEFQAWMYNYDAEKEAQLAYNQLG